MYLQHRNLVLPEKLESKIWRYMDFTKFISMLDTGALFFTRADSFGDRFEGTWPRPSADALITSLKEMQEKGLEICGGETGALQDWKRVSMAMRKLIAINCWHLSEHESEAMWKLYLKSNEGIAVQSTVKRLIDSLDADPRLIIHVGMVNYIDYLRDPIPSDNYLNPFLHKRKSFEHERELRALAANSKISEGDTFPGLTAENFVKEGVLVSANLDCLIESVYVAPTSPPWITHLVSRVVSRYGLKKEVFRSSLEADPLF